MKTWFQIISELLIDLSAGIIVLVFIEQQLTGSLSLLTVRMIFVIVSLVLAKYLRDQTKIK